MGKTKADFFREEQKSLNHVLGCVDRVTLWQQREAFVGKLIKFKHQPSGAKEAPRFPKFIGFREAWDLCWLFAVFSGRTRRVRRAVAGSRVLSLANNDTPGPLDDTRAHPGGMPESSFMDTALASLRDARPLVLITGGIISSRIRGTPFNLRLPIFEPFGFARCSVICASSTENSEEPQIRFHRFSYPPLPEPPRFPARRFGGPR